MLALIMLLSSSALAGPIKEVKICTGNNKTTGFKYTVTTFEGGDRMATCIAFSNSGSGFNQNIYRKSGTNYKTATCNVIYDLDAPSAGLWAFELQDKVRAVYQDEGSTADGLAVDLTCETN